MWVIGNMSSDLKNLELLEATSGTMSSHEVLYVGYKIFLFVLLQLNFARLKTIMRFFSMKDDD